MNNKDIVIKVSNLSKRYRIGVKEKESENFVGAVFNQIISPFKNYRKYRSLYKFSKERIGQDKSIENNNSDIIWALKDVSFEVKRSEAIGIIGRNGAGKSTLLKILSRITDPTNGCAEIQGRVACLLEVGTGFHPELTGRENIYLNGTVLGMKKKEIYQKFDEIVEFSGVEKFIDTPVKRYSSGMNVRLAFSVAAHLEPEILIIDEVLAVGDAAFQQKCLGKMEDVAKEGRTVLFVSHNMGAIARLCDRAIWLDGARLKLDGSASDVISSYLSSGIKRCASWDNPDTLPSNATFRFKGTRLLSMHNKEVSLVNFDNEFMIEISYDIIHPIRGMYIRYYIRDSQGNIPWFSCDTDTTDRGGKIRESGTYVSICKVPSCLLGKGVYYLNIQALGPHNIWFACHDNVFAFEVSEIGCKLTTGPGPTGIIRPLLEWQVKRIDRT